jgi:multidrug resistance efflux pump
MEAARARLELIRAQLYETVIKAPVDALVESLDLERGDLVAAGRPVVTLLRTGSLWVRVYLPEARLGLVQPGLKVKVRWILFRKKTSPALSVASIAKARLPRVACRPAKSACCRYFKPRW